MEDRGGVKCEHPVFLGVGLRVPEEKKADVVKLWVECLLSTRKIAERDEINLSNGKVSEIITEAKKRQPDIEELRALNASLKKGPGYAETLRAVNLLREFERGGLDPSADSLTGAGKILVAHPENHEAAVAAGLYIMSLEKSEKKSFAEVVQEAGRAKEQAAANRRESEALIKQIAEMKSELGPLDEYKHLKEELHEMEVTAPKMNGFISLHKRLDALGFDAAAALSLANELNRRGLSPNEGASELAEALKKHLTLGLAIGHQEAEERRLNRIVQDLEADEEGILSVLKVAGSEVEALKSTIDTLSRTVANLARTSERISATAPVDVMNVIDDAKKEVRRVGDETRTGMEKELAKVSILFDTSSRKINAAASSIVSKAMNAEKAMRKTSQGIVEDMDRVGRRGFQVGAEVANLKPISDVYRFVSEGKGEPGIVFPIAISFLRVLCLWERK